MVLQGKTPLFVCLLFVDASLVALKRKDGCVNSIAIRYNLRHLFAKCANSRMTVYVFSYAPPQLGFWFQFGADTLAHSAHIYLHNMKPSQCHFETKLKKFIQHYLLAPDLLPFVHSFCSAPSSFFFGSEPSIHRESSAG